MNTIEISLKLVSYTINLATRHTKNDTLSSVGFLKSEKHIYRWPNDRDNDHNDRDPTVCSVNTVSNLSLIDEFDRL